MSEQIIRKITGKVEIDPNGSWEDCSPGLYFSGNLVESLFYPYAGRRIKVTIEEMPDEEDES